MSQGPLFQKDQISIRKRIVQGQGLRVGDNLMMEGMMFSIISEDPEYFYATPTHHVKEKQPPAPKPNRHQRRKAVALARRS